MEITIINPVRLAGVEVAAGTTQTVDASIGADLVKRGDATDNNPPPPEYPVVSKIDPITGRIVITAGDQTIGSNSAPVPITSRELTRADYGGVFISSGATLTVPAGLSAGMWCLIKGNVSFDGAATVTDSRTTLSATPYCTLVQTGTDTYDVIGVKV